jgi:uncharacterized protein (DUF885 family)
MVSRSIVAIVSFLGLAQASCSNEQAPGTSPGPVTSGGAGSSTAASVASASRDASAKPYETPAAFAKVRDDAVAEWLADAPSFARFLGLHDADGKVPDLSEAAIEAHIGRLEKQKAALGAVDAAGLSPDDKEDLAILRRRVDVDLFDLVDLDSPHKRPQFYATQFGVSSYLDIEYAPLLVRAKALVTQEEADLRELPHVRENLVLPLSKPVTVVAAKNIAGLAKYLRTDVKKALQDAGDAAEKEHFSTTNELLAKRLDELADWLKKDVIPKADDSHVLGVNRYKKLLLVQEGLTMPLAEFKAIAEEDLKANAATYDELAKTARPTRLDAEHLLGDGRKQVDEVRAFVLGHKLITVPFPDERALVRETPAYMRWNAASILVPGPFEKERRAFYQITLPDPSWPKKEQEEYVPLRGTLLSTTVHEVYPGHFVQYQFLSRAPTRVQKMSNSYSFGEGWAHYTEQMVIAEEGLGRDDPQNQLGQVEDALLRDCRFLASVGIHTESMSVEAATKLFEDRCHTKTAEAREQAVRGTFDPGYFAYTLGKLQILKLRAEAKKKLGDKFSLTRFHDVLLSHGGPPLAIIHDRVLSEL